MAHPSAPGHRPRRSRPRRSRATVGPGPATRRPLPCRWCAGHERRRAGRDAGAVYRRLAPAVLGYLRGQAVAEPEDLLGEIFLQVARDLHRVKGDDLDVRRWVFGVARHRVIDQARRGRRRPAPSGEAVPDRAAPDPAEPFDSELLAGLAALTAEQREVLVLRFVADLPLEAVASITGRQVGAVKALQHRGLARLAQAVSPEARPAL